MEMNHCVSKALTAVSFLNWLQWFSHLLGPNTKWHRHMLQAKSCLLPPCIPQVRADVDVEAQERAAGDAEAWHQGVTKLDLAIQLVTFTFWDDEKHLILWQKGQAKSKCVSNDNEGVEAVELGFTITYHGPKVKWWMVHLMWSHLLF